MKFFNYKNTERYLGGERREKYLYMNRIEYIDLFLCLYFAYLVDCCDAVWTISKRSDFCLYFNSISNLFFSFGSFVGILGQNS